MFYQAKLQETFTLMIIDHAILQERITLMMRNDTKAIIHIDAGKFRKLTEQRDQRQHIPGNRH